MATGTVKWFNNAKGYGFVLPESGGDDLFIHYSSIQMDGYKSLKAGQEVHYELQEGPKGLHAVNIQPTACADAHAAQTTQDVGHGMCSEVKTQPAIEIAAHTCDGTREAGATHGDCEAKVLPAANAVNNLNQHQVESEQHLALEEH